MRTRACSSGIAVALLLLCAAGCGGGATHTTTSPGSSGSSAIRARLTKAGYAIIESTTTGPQAQARPKGEVDAFSVEADFTSPDSFRLGVTAFDTSDDATAYVARTVAALKRSASSASCKADAQCRSFVRAMNAADPPVKTRQVGTTVYIGVVDKQGAKLPLRAFDRIVALASGS